MSLQVNGLLQGLDTSHDSVSSGPDLLPSPVSCTGDLNSPSSHRPKAVGGNTITSGIRRPGVQVQLCRTLLWHRSQLTPSLSLFPHLQGEESFLTRNTFRPNSFHLLFGLGVTRFSPCILQPTQRHPHRGQAHRGPLHSVTSESRQKDRGQMAGVPVVSRDEGS